MTDNNASAQQKMTDKIRGMVIAELYSSGGVSYDRASKELLYFLPGDFINVYVQAFHEAFRDLDGGVSGRGISAANKGELGRANAESAVSSRMGGGWDTKHEPKDKFGNVMGKGHVHNTQKSMKGAKQASAKNMFGYNGAIGEETAALITRVNKRLRSIARDMKVDLDELKNRRLVEDRAKIDDDLDKGLIGKGEASRRIGALMRAQRELDEGVKASTRDGELRAACKGCGSFLGKDWRFCAKCGIEVNRLKWENG